MAFKCSKLFCSCNYNEVFTISYKYCAFAWSNINFTIFCVIDVHISSDIKDKIFWILTIINVILLAFDRVYLFNPELIFFIFELIIIWIVFLLYFIWLKDIWVSLFGLWRLLFHCLSDNFILLFILGLIRSF